MVVRAMCHISKYKQHSLLSCARERGSEGDRALGLEGDWRPDIWLFISIKMSGFEPSQLCYLVQEPSSVGNLSSSAATLLSLIFCVLKQK